MSYSPKNSGAMLQSTHGIKGNFELAMPCKKKGIAFCWRDNDPIANKFWDAPDILQWGGPYRIGEGKIEGVAMIQGNYGTKGNLELVAVDKNTLVHYWRNDDGDKSWNGPYKIADGVQGVPSLIQAGTGKGCFEVVVGKEKGGGLLHFRRDNNNRPLEWRLTESFGSGDVSGCSLIQLDFGIRSGDLELVAVEGKRLVHYRRPEGINSRWENRTVLGKGFTGAPGFIQADSSGLIGNSRRKVTYEIVVPCISGGLAHFSRKPNVANTSSWVHNEDFGSGSYTAVSLIQSNFGNGNLEVAAVKEDGSADHYWWSADAQPKWNGPVIIPQLKRLRVHIKVLVAPSFSIQEHMDATKELFYKIGISVEYPTIEELDIPELIPLAVSNQEYGSIRNMSEGQKLLYENRNNVSGNDVVVYFVELETIHIDGDNDQSTIGGKATHPIGKPSAVVTKYATIWAMAHELGHLLGISKHNQSDDMLMFESGGSLYTITPLISDDEAKKMLKSRLLEEPKC